MKKTMLVLLMTLSASAAFSKQLTVVCERQNPNVANVDVAPLSIVMEIANVNSVPVIQKFVSQGKIESARILDGTITKDTLDLSLQFGPKLWSSARITLSDWQDSFSATGQAKGELSTGGGGFSGSTVLNLKCAAETR